MNSKVRWGVIGSGGIARRRTIPEGIVPAANAELVAVYDVNQEVNAAVAAQFKARAAGSLDELLQSDIDAVYIATPAHLHCDHALQAAAAGKHALCEKPLAITVADIKKMIRAFRKARRNLGTAFMMRFQSQHQEALRMVKDGRLGKLVYARAQLSCWYPPIAGAWRQNAIQGGGGSLIDMGGHCIDLLEMFFGEVRRVTCRVNRLVHAYETEDTAVAMLEFENGAIGTVDACFCIPDKASKNVLELYGSRGSILCRGTIGQGAAGEMHAFIEGRESGYDATQARAEEGGGIIIAPPDPLNTYRAEIEEFSAAILDRRPCSNDARIGMQNQKVICACYKSARTGRSVKV